VCGSHSRGTRPDSLQAERIPLGAKPSNTESNLWRLHQSRRLCWLLLLAIAMLPGGSVTAAELNDYPTSARADYVFGCMKANGDTHTALDQCSCSVDVIASLLPYDRYVEAETVLSLAQVPGFFGAMFRSPPPAKAAVDALRRAQAEAEVRCF
jgi:hypothetical protein